MSLVHHGAMKKRSLETLSHTALSVQHLVRHRTDAAIVFNAGNAPFLPALRAARIPVATHVDGLEWKREKWAGAGRRYYLMAERMAVKWSDALIADAVGIQDYYLDKFNKPTDLITYGAPILDHAGDRPAGRARAHLRWLPPGRRPVRAGEPRRHDRRGVLGQQSPNSR